ncbi:NAD(P)/FAD-dependent oxidoreductase [Modestobacter sp. NPDC049651]|uniref:dihydrolipoyl dehydrogenase family protein n=1 Tax=unclassified Modestobacter TaxID=2643866 RepID=UPI0033EA3454
MASEEKSWDVVVIGAGSTGENVADIAVRGGLSTVLVESALVGGECSYWACMPSKTLLRGSEVLGQARAVQGAAAAVTGQQDVAATLERRNGMTHHWDDSSQVQWVDGAGIGLVRGRARLAGEKRVVVTLPDGSEQTLVARHAVAVCTGSRAAVPPVEGLTDVRPWTPKEATSAQAAPGRLLVVGGGYVGCELATAWAQLGTTVTLLQRGDRLLPALEPVAGDTVLASLKELGVDVRLGVDVQAARRDGDEVVLTVDEAELRGDQVLVATGRAANTEELGLDTVGLTPGEYLDVDESMRVPGTDWLYGVGDVNARRQLTHMGKYQARQAGNAIVARARGEQVDLGDWSPFVATADRLATPSVVFTDPPIGAVGMTAAEAAEAGLPHRVVEYEIGNVAGAAVFADGYSGTAVAVVDTEREVLLGLTFVGPGVTELLHSATIAIVGEVPLSRLWHAVPSYPTISEVWLRLLETYRG